MPYRVATVTTPLWADHQKTLKKGIVSGGVEFKCDEAYQDMLKTSSVQYVPKGATVAQFGDGWIELKNCEKVEAPGSTAVSTTGGIPVVFGKKQYLITIEEVE